MKLYTSILPTKERERKPYDDQLKVFHTNDFDRKKLISSTFFGNNRSTRTHTRTCTHIKEKKGTHTHLYYVYIVNRANGFTLYFL